MYTTVWRFVVHADRLADFERHYGPDGTWARFFRTGRGFISTELFRSTAESGVYVTIDSWESEADFREFKKSRAAEYESLDRQFEELTAGERHVSERSS